MVELQLSIRMDLKQRSFTIGAQLQDTTVLICSYVLTLAYSTPGGDL